MIQNYFTPSIILFHGKMVLKKTLLAYNFLEPKIIEKNQLISWRGLWATMLKLQKKKDHFTVKL